MRKVLPEIFTLLSEINPNNITYDDDKQTRRKESENKRELFKKKTRYFTKKYAIQIVKNIQMVGILHFLYKKSTLFLNI